MGYNILISISVNACALFFFLVRKIFIVLNHSFGVSSFFFNACFIFRLFIFHENTILLLQFWILELVIFTLELVSLVVIHERQELFGPSLIEMRDLSNNWVWNTGKVKKNNNQVRLFTLDSTVWMDVPFRNCFFMRHVSWGFTIWHMICKSCFYHIDRSWKFNSILNKFFSFFNVPTNVSEIILILIVG